MSPITDFTSVELNRIQRLFHKKYGANIKIHVGQSNVSLDQEGHVLVDCPTLFWHARGSNFAVVKVGTTQFRGNFFSTPHHQHEITQEDCDSLDSCVTVLLEAQTDRSYEGRR